MASLLAKPPLDGGALLSLHALLFAFKNLFSRFTWISRVQAKCDHSERVGDCSKEGSNKKPKSCKHKDLHDCFQWQTEINHLQSLSAAPRPLVQTSTRAVSSRLWSERAGRAANKQRNYTQTNSFFIFWDYFSSQLCSCAGENKERWLLDECKAFNIHK